MKARYDIYAELRDQLSKSDSDVAKATGITKSTFSDWKSGRSNPGGDKINKICDYFNVSSRVFYKEGDPRILVWNERAVTDFEFEIILALRNKPDMKDAICKLLDVKEKKEDRNFA